MKKFFVDLFVILFIFLVCFISVEHKSKIPPKQAQISLEEKYPDIRKIIAYPGYFFIIKANEKNLKGVYEKETGKQIIPPEYEHLERFNNILKNVFFYTNDKGLHRVIDYQNNIVFQATYDKFNIKSWCGIETWKKNKVGMVTYTGIEILKPEYDEIECQDNGFFNFYYIVKKDNKYGVFDNAGNAVIPFQNKKLEQSGSGSFIAFEDKGKKGIMDINGSIIVKPMYSTVSYGTASLNNSEPFFIVCNYNENVLGNELCGTIDETTGEEHLPLIFMRDIARVSNEYYMVREPNDDAKKFIVDKNGKKMHKKGYNNIYPLNEKYYRATYYDKTLKENITGVIDINGNEILSPSNNFEIADTAAENGLIKIKQNDRFGIAYNNQIIVKPVYIKIYFIKGHVLLLSEENNKKYYYVASIEDFANNKGNLEKCKK
ncbi:MAG: WG repeat-containing protein, partial [Candidatus Gastranaerophilales bacterium]|nr:WG repeat-containing protein [Candidatus Gastranaerophilales bacterium]